MTTSLLDLSGVGRRFGALDAVSEVTLSIAPGERVALIGPNGAGKSTLLNLISGETLPTSGTVRFIGTDVTQGGSASRARSGIGKTFQRSCLFDDITVAENVALACTISRKTGRRWWTNLRRDARLWETVGQELDTIGLRHRASDLAGALSHGERRQIEVGLALATAPSLLLLDEPTAAMSVAETHDFVQHVAALPRPVTVLIIEHDLDVVFELAQRVIVLSAGRVIADGTPAEIQESPAVQEAYLGAEDQSQLFVEAP